MTTKVPKPYQAVVKFLKDYKPDEIILLGDYMDVSALSSYDLSVRGLIEGKRYLKELEVAESELHKLQKLCNKVTYMAGNHEDRATRYAQQHAELKGMIEIEHKLALKLKCIEWVPIGKEIKRGKLYFTHGIFYNQAFAKKTALSFGCSVVVGHTHRHQVHTEYPKKQKYPYACYGLGTLGDTDPSYLKGRPAGHINQFAVVEYTTKQFNLYPITIINNSFIHGGKEWKATS